MGKFGIFSVLLIIAVFSYGLFSKNSTLLPIWDGAIPNYKPSNEKEESVVSDILRIHKVQTPTIEVFLPPKRNATGQAVIICPGGGYGILAYNWEGVDVAKALNAKGIAAIVLKYRLPSPQSSLELHKSPLLDGLQAIKKVRENATEWGIDKQKVGIMGFSAGGHLASTIGTHYDKDSRPDFMILIYPVISMQKDITHLGSRNNLLGETPSTTLINQYSNHLQVNSSTPPTFLLHAADDQVVVVENSIRMYQALVEHKVPVEMHLYPKGGHGFGLAIGKEPLQKWPDLLTDWMAQLD
ncbi:alpha/beta hydrolase [Glaciecola sp. 1036]|uniref:alpha/beta hydrolase n=1 Tax=Alteromonadaceae TaxID=72275 RepID=UPI003D05805F